MADDTIRSLSDLRTWYGDQGKGMSDEDMMAGFAKVSGVHPAALADAFGYDPGSGSMTGERFTAAGANYSGSLQGAAAGAGRALGLPTTWLDRKRRANDFQASVADERAKNLGAVDSFKDVHGLGDLGNYAAGQLVGASPYLVEGAADAFTGGLVSEGLAGLRGAGAAARLASMGPEAFGAARSAANTVGRTAGVAVGSYPSSVGMALQAQRDQNGTEDLGTAAVAGAGISALNILNPTERVAARLPNFRLGIADDMRGVGGAIARTGLNAGITGAEQAGVMVGQAGLNQFARTGVDPTATMTSPDALDRYGEAAAAGGTLGSLLGAAHGGWRSKASKPSVDVAPDLLERGQDKAPPAADPLQLGYDSGAGTYITFPDGSTATGSDSELMHRFGISKDQLDNLRDTSAPRNNAPVPPGAPPAATPGMPPAPAAPGADRAAVAAAAAEFQRRRAVAHDVLVDNDPVTGQPAIQLTPDVIKLHHDLVQARDDGIIAPEQYVGMAGAIKEALYTNDKKSINAVRTELQSIRNPKPAKGQDQGGKARQDDGAAAVPAAAAAERGDLTGRSDTAVPAQPVAPEARDDANTTAPGASNDANPPVRVEPGAQPGVGSGPGELAAAPAAPAVTAPALKGPGVGGFQKAPKVLPRAVARPPEQRTPLPSKHDNVPDLAAAIAKEQGWSPEHADVYVQHTVEGRSLSKIAADLGIGKSTAGDMLKRMTGEMDSAKRLRLEAGAEPAVETRAHDHADNTVVEEPKATEEELRDMRNEEGEVEAHEPDAAAADLKETGDAVDEDNLNQGQADLGDAEQSHINISDSPHGEGETKAKNDTAADKAYRAQRKVSDPELQRAWDRINETVKKGRVAFKDLGEGQKLMFEEATRQGAEKAVEEHIALSAAHKELGKFSKGDTGQRTTSAAIADTLRKWFPSRLKDFADKVVIHDTAEDASKVDSVKSQDLGKTKAFFDTATGKVHMIAENIRPGEELGVFLHEMGIHARLSGAIAGRMKLLARTVESWAKHSDPEIKAIGKAALDRVKRADGDQKMDAGLRDEELVAYATEEAVKRGVTPSADPSASPVQQWLARMLNSFKEAMGKILGLPAAKLPDLTPQHLVDMAYGAAHMEAPARDEAPAKEAAAAAPEVKQSVDSPPELSKPAQVMDWVKNRVGGYKTHPGLLGFLTLDQMAKTFSKLPAVEAYSKTMQHMGGASSQMMHVSDDISKAWTAAKKDAGTAVSARFDALVNRSTRSQIWPDRPLDHADNGHLNADDLDVQREHAALQAEWKALPKSLQDVFTATQKDHAARFERYIAAQKDSVIRTFYPAMDGAGPSRDLVNQAAKLAKGDRAAFMEEHGTDRFAVDTFNQLWDALDDQGKMSRLIGPYAPQARFGDHIVSYKSKDFQGAEQALVEATKAVDAIRESDAYKGIADVEASLAGDKAKLKRATTEARREQLKSDIADSQAELARLKAPHDAAVKLMEERQEALNSLKGDDSAYRVEFFENRNEAKTREDQLKAFFGEDGTEVTRAIRDQWLTKTDGITPAWIKRIEAHLTDGLTGKDALAVQQSLREMYLQHLPGTSPLKNQLKRRKVAGVKDVDAQRSFANKAMRDAFAISRLEHQSELQQHLQALRGSGDEDAQLVGNELAKRVAQNTTIKNNALIQGATNLTYLTQLGLSPGFLIQQGAQQWVNSLPIMAARHGVKSVKLIAAGTSDAMKMLKTSFDKNRSMNFQVDIPAAIKAGTITKGEGKMLQGMFDRGLIDITSGVDLSTQSNGDGGYVARAAEYANFPAKQLETINRISTALAAYRAEHSSRIKGGHDVETSENHASAYADKLVSETHMNYSAENRARFFHPSTFGGWGRVAFQFRSYQQGMAYLTVRNLVDGLRGDKEALRAAAYMAGTQMAVAGTSGLPIPGLTAVLAKAAYNMFQDDDDKVTNNEVKEAYFQGLKQVGGETFARAFSSGLPAAMGVNVAQKLGMGNTFDVAPMVDNDKFKNSKDMIAAYMMAIAGGPVGSGVQNYAEAIRQATHGEFAKAATQFLPKVLSDALKAEEFQRTGTKDTRGNTILSPEEIGTTASIIKALGLQPEDMNRTMDQRTAFFDARTNRHDIRAGLLAKFAQASLAGEDTSSVRDEVNGFNERHPDSKIASGQLQLAIVKAREQQRLMRNGVPVGKRDQKLAEDMGIEQ